MSHPSKLVPHTQNITRSHPSQHVPTYPENHKISPSSTWSHIPRRSQDLTLLNIVPRTKRSQDLTLSNMVPHTQKIKRSHPLQHCAIYPEAHKISTSPTLYRTPRSQCLTAVRASVGQFYRMSDKRYQKHQHCIELNGKCRKH